MDLISIGQFSKMTRLTVKALRLYDENGLLPPARIDASSGYRYYRQAQIDRAEIIKALRAIDMPLDEIHLVLNAETQEKKQDYLRKHKTRLVKQLESQRRNLSYLETMLNQGRTKVQNGIQGEAQGEVQGMPYAAPPSYEISISEAAEMTIAAVKIRTSLGKISNDISQGFADLMPALAQAQVLGPPMIIYHHIIDEVSDGDIEVCVPVATGFVNSGAVYGRSLKAARTASLIHKGEYERIAPAYHQLPSWITEQGFEIAGPPRETYLNDPQLCSPAELLTKLEFPITSLQAVEDK